MKEEDARILAKQLEQDIKEEMSNIKKEKCCGLNKVPDNNLSSSKKQEELQTQNKPKPMSRQNEISQASVMKVEMEQMEDVLYEVVTVRTQEGNIAVWKSPVLLRPCNNQLRRMSLHKISPITNRNYFRKRTRKRYNRCNFNRTYSKSNNIPITVRKSLDKGVRTRRSLENIGLKNIFDEPITSSPTLKETPDSPSKTPSTQVVPKSSGNVSVTNISQDTSPGVIEDLAKQVGVLASLVHDKLSGCVDLTFSNPEDAQQFCIKYHRKMIDLSIIKVALA